MRAARPAYNLISNNCQNFAVNLLDKVQIGAHREFATAAAVYQRATDEDAEMQPKPHRQNTVQIAQQVMDEHTTKLDDDHD